jgi:glutathione S-transferase
MKLYYSPGACSLSPHIVLRESGLDFEIEKVDLATKKTETGQDFFGISENGYVPALEIEPGVVLTEGPAIVQYIADLVPTKKLAPTNGTMDRYRLQSWLGFINSELHKGFGALFNPATPADYKKIALDTLTTRFGIVEKRLAKHDYLLGSHYSVADVYLFVICSWTGHVGIDLKQWPGITRFNERVGSRPAVQAAMKAEGLLK